MLDSLLLDTEGKEWKKTVVGLDHPREYEDWLGAQAIPTHMKLRVSNWEDIIFPLEKTQSPTVLIDMWRYIDMVGIIHGLRTYLIVLRLHYLIEL